MRFSKILLVSLAIAATSTFVQAAPAPSPLAAEAAASTPFHHMSLEKRGWVLDQLKPLFEKALKTLECGACVAALVGAKDIAWLNKNWVLDAVNELCPTLAKMPKDVCSGLVYSQGPVLVDAVLKANLLSGDGKHICFQVLGACPAPGVSSGSVSFPKPRPLNAMPPTHSGVQIDVLHLSDWHVDPEYAGGTEAACNRPLCCRKYADSPLTPTQPASSWGEYSCDAPQKLAQSLLGHAAATTGANLGFAILTGDVPPHDVWVQNQQTVVPIEEKAYNTMAAGLGAMKLYPTIGNHEAGPTNLFPTPASGGSIQWLYNSLADDWSKWLPQDAINSVKNFGAYSVSPRPGFRIISLNTNFCYTLNFYLYAKIKDYDPHGELKWLVAQLQAAEDAGERVWIIAHISPAQTDCIQNWSAQYYQVVQRYSPHVIAEQFYGHSHRDEFALFYAPGTKNTQNAISTAWIGPSVTPHTKLNPGYRVYKVDTKSWNVFDSQTYVADLSKAKQWDAAGSEPDWHLEYSARQAYGAYVPIAADQPLSAAWWHNVTSTFEVNDEAFQKYWTYRSKSSGLEGACVKGGDCQKQIICDLRAGKSTDSCTGISFALKRSLEEMEAEAADVSGLHSLYKRAPEMPWNTKLC